MKERDDDPPQQALAPDYVPYDKARLSYANTFTNPWKSNTIRVMEWMTGKYTLLRLIRRFERHGVEPGQPFWRDALREMRIELRTPPEQIARIPASGALVVVANHPHGLIDGMILAELIGRVRTDYKILTRSLLTGVEEISRFMIPVPFAHEPDALELNLKMRKQAMDQLAAGGVVALFPSGSVASSATMSGPAEEAVWNPFTAKLIRRSGAQVLPIHFTGQNSRAYQVANRLSPTLRQGLLIHEVVRALGHPQAPVVGQPIPRAEIEARQDEPRRLMSWLRAHTLSLTR